MKQTAVEWLAEKYNYVTWMRNRDEISAGLADEWRKHYLEQAKEMEKQHTLSAQMDMFHFINNLEYGLEYLDKRDKAEEFAEQYYKQMYGG